MQRDDPAAHEHPSYRPESTLLGRGCSQNKEET